MLTEHRGGLRDGSGSIQNSIHCAEAIRRIGGGGGQQCCIIDASLFFMDFSSIYHSFIVGLSSIGRWFIIGLSLLQHRDWFSIDFSWVYHHGSIIDLSLIYLWFSTDLSWLHRWFIMIDLSSVYHWFIIALSFSYRWCFFDFSLICYFFQLFCRRILIEL